MTVESLVAAYGAQYDAIRTGTGLEVERLWLELGGPDDRRAAAFVDAAVDVVNAAAADTAILVEQYVAEYVDTVSRRPAAAVDPLDLAEFVVDQLRGGVNAADVYRRPAITARTALANGRTYEQAMAAAGARARGTAAADIGLAHRRAGRAAMDRPGVDGYRRVLTGVSCTLCRIASTQRYTVGELMPIHTHCDCRVAPIVDGYDGGRIVNRELYRELKAAGDIDRITAQRQRGAARPAEQRAAATRDRDRARRRLDELEAELADETDPARRRRLEQRVDREDGRVNAATARLDDLGTGPVAPTRSRRPAGDFAPYDDLGTGIPARRTAADVRVDPAPAVRTHGELGPVLVDDRHRFTAARRDVDTVTDPDELRTQRPPAPPADPPADPVEPAGRARAPRWTVDSPDVIRAASRRNVPPEQVVAELEAKRARRIAEQAAERAEARNLTVDSPQVVKAAARFGVTPDEVFAARGQVADVRRVVLDTATRVQLDAFATLDAGEALKLARPPKGAAGAEYDWLARLSPGERNRLSRMWFVDDPALTPDVVSAQAQSLGAIRAGSTTSEFADWWLYHSRRYEAAGAIRRGRPPSTRAYSGEVDVDDLIPLDGGYRASDIIGKSDIEVAAHIAQVNRAADVDDALGYLGRAADPTVGPSPYRMSYQAWHDEVRDLEYGLRNYPEELPATAWDRLAELVPEYLDEPGTSYEELYTRIVTTARRAGEEVPEHARIPWQ